jgi:hypothetical protein
MPLSGFHKTANLLLKDASLHKEAFFERFTRFNRALKGVGKAMGADNYDVGRMLSRGEIDDDLLESIFAARGLGDKGKRFVDQYRLTNAARQKLSEGAKAGGIDYRGSAESFQNAVDKLRSMYKFDKRIAPGFDDTAGAVMQGIRRDATPNMDKMINNLESSGSWWSKLKPETRSKLKWGVGGVTAVGAPIGVYNYLKPDTPQYNTQPYSY